MLNAFPFKRKKKKKRSSKPELLGSTTVMHRDCVKSVILTSKECTQNHGKNVLDTDDVEPLWCCALREEGGWQERNLSLSMSVVGRARDAEGRVA